MVYRKVFGINWLCEIGSQEKLLKEIKPNQRLLSNFNNNRYGIRIFEENEIIPFVNKYNGFICEILHTYPKKLHFDIDGKDTTKYTLEDIKNIIKKYFGNVKLAISGYENENKKSYHIIAYEYIIYNAYELDQIKKIVKHIHYNECDFFDWKIYTKNRPMKCINQSKPNKPLQKIIENENLQNHFICSYLTGNEQRINFNEIMIEDIINEELILTKTLQQPKHKLKNDFKPEDLNDAKKLLYMMPINENISH